MRTLLSSGEMPSDGQHSLARLSFTLQCIPAAWTPLQQQALEEYLFVFVSSTHSWLHQYPFGFHVIHCTSYAVCKPVVILPFPDRAEETAAPMMRHCDSGTDLRARGCEASADSVRCLYSAFRRRKIAHSRAHSPTSR